MEGLFLLKNIDLFAFTLSLQYPGIHQHYFHIEVSFDTIPTHHYHANSAWQQFVILAHNLLVNFQIETGLTKRNRTLKNTNRWPLKSIRTLRFELINRAGHLVRPEGRLTLRLQRNKHTEKQYRKICNALQKAA